MPPAYHIVFSENSTHPPRISSLFSARFMRFLNFFHSFTGWHDIEQKSSKDLFFCYRADINNAKIQQTIVRRTFAPANSENQKLLFASEQPLQKHLHFAV